MPVEYLRSLTASERTRQSNVHLGLSLCFIAGAINAGGFLAIGMYTSHMTGVVSSMADDLVLGKMALVQLGLISLVSFVSGAACSAVMINWARRRQSRHAYTMPLLLEAAMLLAFGLVDALQHGAGGTVVGLTAGLLCFIMGLQNAMITKISNAEIRTTHVTGLVTDIGIELGKLLYWNRASLGPPVMANRERLSLHLRLVGTFFLGGLIGALGFQHAGYVATLPLALALAALSSLQFLPVRATEAAPR
ncbi:DUF1275 domain-containing protein [Aquabacterium fontiphilum]|jgi:uncharacterized membrane protein YoaK (UPF0700 family)|uniref:YoaK family protein n=1 Tax=Aquabacterium fontiphilum TaxID=450365 RepID=UPI0013773D95|nr:YoaK family protein [Aquabacterium fontiphilum]NBD21582.1 DUF1275 domain-containing protein [Aquabacterium fontiphilum]